MAFTTEELTSIRQALVNFAIGDRVQSIRLGDKLTWYANTDFSELKKLFDEAMGQSITTRKPLLASTSKGIRYV